MKKTALPILVLLVLVLRPEQARAHALGADCRPSKDGKFLEVEAYFDDDTPAAHAAVNVYDSDSELVMQGKTDGKGRWRAPLPAPGRYQVVVDSGDGHRVTKSITLGGSALSPELFAEGPTRREFTSFPWVKVGIGLAIIAVLALAFLLIRGSAAKRPAAGE